MSAARVAGGNAVSQYRAAIDEHADELDALQAAAAGYVGNSDARLVVGSGIIRGRINADGTKAAGTGFTSSKTATGTYAISFSTAFAAIPAIVLTAIPTSYSTVVALLKSPATSGFTVETRHTPDAGQYDDPFHFIAMAL